MIVIKRNGRTTVLTGWRAWAAGAAVLITAWLVVAFMAFIVIGTAITIGAALLILVPAIVVVSLLAGLLRR